MTKPLDQLDKTFRDFHAYLDSMEKLAKPLDSSQRYALSNVLSVLVTLLVALKRDSHLGELKSPFNFHE